jgi:hypothetical protein
MPRGQRDGSLRQYSRLSRPEPILFLSILFLSSSSLIVLTRLGGTRSRPLLLKRYGVAGNRTRTSGSVARNSGH